MSRASKREAKGSPSIDAGVVARAFVQVTTPADAPLIRQVLGDTAVGSLTEVARAFGVSCATVRHTWRRDGMPGQTRRGPGQHGRFILAEIVCWLLSRQALADEGRRGVNGKDNVMRERLTALEVERAELAVTAQRQRLAQQTGNLADVGLVSSRWNSLLAILSNDIMGIPRDLVPALCQRCARSAGGEMERLLRLALVRISEKEVVDGQ